ncbi:thioredoxin domain-containing protein [Carboxylicivirga sp. RSCT41]|uniref:thioredoxin domain-containing protein n=1 Tax=Carboxylicivirga agarovorans TaxID=3417570 RepID=UPI003D32E538
MSKGIKGKNIWLIAIVTLLTGIAGVTTLRHYNNAKLLDELNTELENDIVLGDYNAPKNIILFFDYNCGYCKKFFKQVYPQLDKEYIKTGKAKLTLRLICSGNDEKALLGYQTAICINKYGNFGKLHKLLLHQSNIIYSTQFQDLVEGYISSNEFLGECILSSDQNDVIRNIYQFQELKSKGTPTFVIDDEIIVGLKDFSFFKKILN